MWSERARYTTPAGVTFLLLIASQAAVAEVPRREEAMAYRTQGYERQLRGDRADAISWYRKAVEIDASYAVPLNDLGILLEAEGRLEEAVQVYERALRVQPDYLAAHANLAMLYERLGEQEKAVYHWLKRSQGGEPNDPWTDLAERRLIALGALKAPAATETPPMPAVVRHTLMPQDNPHGARQKTLPAPTPASEPAEKPPSVSPVVEREFHTQARSLDAFRTLTEDQRQWP